MPCWGTVILSDVRFQITREFSDPAIDWTDNNKWFDMKLLADLNSEAYSVPMKNKSYSNAVKQVLCSLGIPFTHLVHIGHVLGEKYSRCWKKNQVRSKGWEIGTPACKMHATQQSCL